MSSRPSDRSPAGAAVPSLPRPGHDRHRADGIGRGAVDDLRTDGEIDQRVVLDVDQPVDPSRLEEDASLLAEDLLLVAQLRDIDIDGARLAAGHREIRRILVEAERLAPATL